MPGHLMGLTSIGGDYGFRLESIGPDGESVVRLER